MTKIRLETVGPAEFGLGRTNIMDPALAQRHGIRYVHAAVAAIDIDRAFETDPGEDQLPEGWEVFLTECALLSLVDGQSDGGMALLEDLCLSVLDEDPGEPRLGSQVTFAVFHALHREAVSPDLKQVFHSWRSPPKQLLKTLDDLFENEQDNRQAFAAYCLGLVMGPPLSPPALELLEGLASSPIALGD